MTPGTRKRHELSAAQLMDIASRLREFDFHGERIRVLYEDGCAWIVLADVLHALCYKVKAAHMAKTLRPEEIDLKDIGAKSSLAYCVNRAGLYVITQFASKQEASELYEWCKENIYREQSGTPYSEDELTAAIIQLVHQLTAEEKAGLLANLQRVVHERR